MNKCHMAYSAIIAKFDVRPSRYDTKIVMALVFGISWPQNFKVLALGYNYYQDPIPSEVLWA